MKQIVQNLKSGKMEVLEVPLPTIGDHNILVRVHHSLISAGTEGSKVSTARKSYIGKAREKPAQVKQVLETLKKEGVQNTYRKVMNKLDAWAPLGYSCAGEVVEVGARVRSITVGDRVACAGQSIANHAEMVSVPENLCVKVPKNVSLADAAYNTLGAIALQGVRQADLRLAESCVVIGLGLIGQLTVQMLKAAGVQVFGIDLDAAAVEKARQSGADLAMLRGDAALEPQIRDAAGGYGVDAVIITAGTTSLDPIELAGRLCRKKGTVVIVGAVPTGFSREQYYVKELQLKMSCSYGPGRYDPDYEEKGVDYPYAYVRWTENRNMAAFLKLIADQKIDCAMLTSHHFDLEKASEAYELILNKSEPFLGIILNYDVEKSLEKNVRINQNSAGAAVRIGFIGAGSFAQTYLLPSIQAHDSVEMVGVANASGNSARTVSDKYGFTVASTDYRSIVTDFDINTVFIATRHNLHEKQVFEALQNGKNVFVEKPLAISEAGVLKIHEAYSNLRKNSRNGKDLPRLMVGFNRRFAPLIQEVKPLAGEGPLSINYRINAGHIPADHWTQDPDIGGGRIIGEVCHFVDLAMYLSGSLPIRVSAFAGADPANLRDNLVVNLAFENGSIATISYFANGSRSMPKEYLEIFGNGVSAVIDDFRQAHIYGRKKRTVKLMRQDKGHREEVRQFISAIESGAPTPIPFEGIYYASMLPFKIIESIKTGKTISLNL